MEENKKLKEFWNNCFSNAPVYEVKEKWINDQKFNDSMKNNLKSDSTVLDYGCGVGWALMEAYHTINYKKGIGIDTSINAIDIANKIKDLSNLSKLSFICGDEKELNNYPNYFDFIISINTIDVVPDEIGENILLALFKSLKPSGKIFIGMNPVFSTTEMTELLKMTKVGNYYFKDGIMRCNYKKMDEWKDIFKKYFIIEDEGEFIVSEREKKYPRRMFLLSKKNSL